MKSQPLKKCLRINGVDPLILWVGLIRPVIPRYKNYIKTVMVKGYGSLVLFVNV